MASTPSSPEDYGSIASNNGSNNINTVENTRTSIKLHATLDSIGERQQSSPLFRMLSSSPAQTGKINSDNSASSPPPNFQRHPSMRTPLLSKKDDKLNGEPSSTSRGDDSKAQSGESE